ncbi:transposase [Brevibacterium linens]|uniref:transposase n=1 Tax=Brevibacterium linens TaxID=1703 RepID=UPI003AF31C72
MPGVGIKTEPQVLLATAFCSTFRIPGHLATYDAIAPVARRTAKTIPGSLRHEWTNRRLKNARSGSPGRRSLVKDELRPEISPKISCGQAS